MQWIALLPPETLACTQPAARVWPLLQFTPRVARLDEAVLMDVSPVLRLWGGRARLLQRLQQALQARGWPVQAWAEGRTAITALAAVRLRSRGEPVPCRVPDDLPLHVLSAAQPHLPVLTRLGCRRWADLRALPRAGLARRFGPALSEALDQAWGQRPHGLSWLTPPPVFDESLELSQPARHAAEMLEAAHGLLGWLRVWLQQRQLGAAALRWDWRFDLRRIDGMALPAAEGMVLRTAVPTQDMQHLMRLLQEQWARIALKAPARSLQLRSEQVLPWQGETCSWLPDALRDGQRLHTLVERLQARLGEQQVCTPLLCEDHRPEHMQHWQPARSGAALAPAARDVPQQGVPAGAALMPPWLLQRPLALPERGGQPWHRGPLQLLGRARRVEAGWWSDDMHHAGPPAHGARRDYYLAHGERAGWLWVFCEPSQPPRWFLHGIFA